MAKLTKKAKALQGKVETTRLYPLSDALSLVKQCATAKFDESIDVAVQLGIDGDAHDALARDQVEDLVLVPILLAPGVPVEEHQGRERPLSFVGDGHQRRNPLAVGAAQDDVTDRGLTGIAHQSDLGIEWHGLVLVVVLRQLLEAGR